MTDVSDQSHRPSRRRRITVWVLILLVAALIGLLARVYKQWHTEPTYWQAHRSFIATTSEPRLTQLADGVQLRAPSEWTRPIGAGDGVRTLRFNFDEINAWLAVRLDDWLANQNSERPSGVGEVMMSQRDGQLVVAFDYESDNIDGIVSVFLGIEQEPEALRMGIDQVRIGQFKLSRSTVIDKLAEASFFESEENAKLIDELRDDGAIGPLILPVDGTRQARLLGLEVRPEGFDLKVRVEYTDGRTP